MKRQLAYQSDRIEGLLGSHGISARVTGGTVTPRWIAFQILPGSGERVARIRNLSEELALALDVPTVRVTRQGAAVAVEIPRDDPVPVRLLPLLEQLAGTSGVPALTAVLGLADDGAPLLIRVPSPNVAHILVAGTTGSGKSVLLRALLTSLAVLNPPRALQLVLIDPGGEALASLSGLPHLLQPVVCDPDAAAQALVELVGLMERRHATEPRIVVCIDELADLLMVGGDGLQEALMRLTQRGRGAGIHIVAATQKPTAAVLGSLVKANFPVRLVGRVMSIDDARVATGRSGTGAEQLLGRGDFLAVAEGRLWRFQVAYAGQDELAGLCAGRGWDPVPRRLMTLVQPRPEPEDNDLVARLERLDWDPGRSYAAACRALGVPAGGASFYQVRDAVDRLRETSTTTTDTPPERLLEAGGGLRG